MRASDLLVWCVGCKKHTKCERRYFEDFPRGFSCARCNTWLLRPNGGNYPDHPPVEGGYRGDPAPADAPETERIPCGDISAAQWCCEAHMYEDEKTRQAQLAEARAEGASSVIGEAVLADAVRTQAPRALTRLPEDSSERKRIPLCSGLIDYFPQAIADAIDLLESGEEWGSDSNAILLYLAERDYTTLFCACLDALQDELCGPPTQCRSRYAAERWGAALIAVAQVSVYGNEKHNPGQPLHHARGKSMDHADCIARHTWDAGGFDGPMRHSACRAWRAGALSQAASEAEGAPLARGARLPEGGAQ